jgi:hypothetical protein
MKLDWQQLSPKERETALKHYVLHDKIDSQVTAQKIWEEMSQTHFLFCDQSLDGPAVFQFIPGKGKRTGLATSHDLNEGIYKAALRALGVDVEDRREGGLPQQVRSAARHAPLRNLR